MLLFEHKHICKVTTLKFNANEDIVFKNYGSLMPTKTARRDYNELLPGFVTSQTPDKTPPPGTCNEGGEAMLRCFRERKSFAMSSN